MSDPVSRPQEEAKSTRLDEPHDLLTNGEPTATGDQVWLAMAGKDPTSMNAQIERQSSELISHVQQKSNELDARQDEVNAKLALLDNELRKARLHSLSQASELVELSPTKEESVDSSVVSNRLSEFEDIDELAEIQHDSEAGWTESYNTDIESESKAAANEGIASSSAPSDMSYGLEEERRLLERRKVEIDRRQRELESFHDEAQAMQEDALRQRLACEQMATEFRAATADADERLGQLRHQIDELYAAAGSTLHARRRQLQDLRQKLYLKQEQLRDQSNKLQDWIDSRHEAIREQTAQLDAREQLLNLREHRLQEDASKWEAERLRYRRQLRSLVSKLETTDADEHQPDLADS